jgi:hypothetical protein
MKRILAAAALAVVAFSANAQLTFTGGSQAPVTGVFDPAPTFIALPSFTEVLRSPLTINTTAGSISATFLGKEALDHDTFQFTLGGIVLNNTDALGTMASTNVPAGPLGFSFIDVTSGNTTASFAILGSFSGTTFTPFSTAAYDLVLGFNDGLNVDGDFDDMVVGLKVSAVPEPETYALMLAGIGAIGFIARRRRKTLSA